MTRERSKVPALFRPRSVIQAYDELSSVLRRTDLSDHAREENRTQAFLATFAAMEGVLREDMDGRLAAPANDVLTGRLRLLSNRARAKKADVSIDDILDAWRLQFTQFAHEIGKLRQYVEYRNWLAHGRCISRPRSGQPMDPHRVADISRRIASLIPTWPGI